MDGNNHIDLALREGVDELLDMFADRTAVNRRISEKYAELKSAGFNITVVRGMVKEAQMDPDDRNALYQQQEEYRISLGLLAAIGPLGEAAVERETAAMPRPFAEQPVHNPKRPRGRPRKDRNAEAVANARLHLAFENVAAGDV